MLVAYVVSGIDSDFFGMLDDAGIPYERSPRVPNGPQMSGDTIQLLCEAGPHAAWALAIASIVKAWIASRSSRKVIFTMKDEEIQNAFEGMSAKEIADLIPVLKSMMILETQGQDSKSPTP